VSLANGNPESYQARQRCSQRQRLPVFEPMTPFGASTANDKNEFAPPDCPIVKHPFQFHLSG